jgi:hypothetical protein
MAYKQVKDILQRASDFHGMLKDFYNKINDITQKESVKLLVDYMARHEKYLQDITSQISAEQEKQITEEWFKYESEYATCNCFDQLKIDKNSGVDDVIDVGLTLNQCLINLFHHAVVVAPTQEIKALFSSLEIEEIAEKKKLARMRGM